MPRAAAAAAAAARAGAGTAAAAARDCFLRIEAHVSFHNSSVVRIEEVE